MQKGTLQPASLSMYTSPVVVNLQYDEITKDPFPTPQEAQVWFKINGDKVMAFVPLRIVDEDKRVVTATLLGESEGKILVSFPPTNFGQTRFSASEQDLEKIALDIAEAGI